MEGSGDMSDGDTLVTFDGDMLVTFDIETNVEFRVDAPKRQISGLILPWGKTATPRGGFRQLRFERGSVYWSSVGRVKLLRDHDMRQPVGVALKLENRTDGLHGTFKIARGVEGDALLESAEDGILDGFSAGLLIDPDGAEVDGADRSIMSVTSARMVETTITAIPAFDDARVQRVAAMLRVNADIEEGSMADNDDKSRGDGDKGKGGTTVLDHPDSAMERFEAELDQRFETIADKVAELQQSTAEGLTNTVSEALKSVFSALEDAGASDRAKSAAMRIRVNAEEPVYRFDGAPRTASFVRDWWRAQTERDHDAIERLRKFGEQQRDLVQMLHKFPPEARAQFAVDTSNASSVIPPGYRPDLFVNELRQGRPIVAGASRGTITDATPFTVPRFVSSTGATADHTEGTNPTPGSITLDAVTVSPGAVSGRFELTREIVDAANPAIDAISLAAMRESYNQQTEAKAYAELNTVTGVQSQGVTDTQLTTFTDTTAAELLRQLLADYSFTRFASPSGAVMGQKVTRYMARVKDADGRPLFPSVGASNASGLGNAVDQAWFVDGMPFVPAWAVTDGVGDDVAVISNRTDWWVWESPLLTFRFEEKSGPAIIELALFAYFATKVLRPSGVAVLNRTA